MRMVTVTITDDDGKTVETQAFPLGSGYLMRYPYPLRVDEFSAIAGWEFTPALLEISPTRGIVPR